MIEAETSPKGSSAAANDRYQPVELPDLVTEAAMQLRFDPPQRLSNLWQFVVTIMSDFADTQVDTSTCWITAPEVSTISKGRTSSNDVGTKVRECRPRQGRYIAQPERLELQVRPDLSAWNQQNLHLDGFSLLPLQLQHLARHCHDYILPDRIKYIHALRNTRSSLKQIRHSPRHELSRHIRKVLDRDHGRISRQLENLERKAYRRLLFTVVQIIGKSNTTKRLIGRLGRSRIWRFRASVALGWRSE
jgi:hypothetical protein